MNPLIELKRFGQSVWYDNIRRALLTSGELERMMEDYGVTGITSNPVIFEKAISGGAEYDDEIRAYIKEGLGEERILDALTTRDVQLAADILKPVHEATGGLDGYVSIEVNPALAHDADATVAEAGRLHSLVGRKNILIKVPGTAEGIVAIRELVCQGYSINVTLLFSITRYEEAAIAYIRALERRVEEGKPIKGIFGVASFFVSRVDTLVDKLLEKRAEHPASNDEKARLRDLLGRVAVANAKLAFIKHAELFHGKRFAALEEKGASAQRLLWASTGTKNPLYSDIKYIEGLVERDTINTMPLQTLLAFKDHGKAGATLATGLDEAAAIMEELKSLGIDYNDVAARLEREGVKGFKDGFDQLISCIAAKKEAVPEGRGGRGGRAQRAWRGGGVEFDLHGFEAGVAGVVKRLQDEKFAERLMARDASLWKKADKKLIRNALGWLALPHEMDGFKDSIKSFADTVRDSGVKSVVLLGMGGSSLAPLVLKETFGSTPGYPELTVLDSIDPGAIKAVDEALGPARESLFIVSSKSGTTIEPLSLFEYFYSRVKDERGDDAGKSFIAITDPGTPLEGFSRKYGFRRHFLNPPDIGGRFSALSYFGLVPAALAGIDITRLLYHAQRIHAAVDPGIAAQENPVLKLGAALGYLSSIGRDKVTFFLSEDISSFGLWVEQLLAESTGKDRKGMVPITGEPAGGPDDYGPDRVFVSISLGPLDKGLDAGLKALGDTGHPVIRFCLKDPYELGGEFLRWEVATAAAGVIMGINPFDQPDVELSKRLTMSRLEKSNDTAAASLEAPGVELEDGPVRVYFNGSASRRLKGSIKEGGLSRALKGFFASIREGDYLGLLAYFNPFDGHVREALQSTRRLLFSSGKAATQFGYGPRYLHSTGQLHKGGADKGVFMILTHGPADDIKIPGSPFSFSELELSQAFADMEALDTRGRSVVLFNLKDPTVGSLKQVDVLIRGALS